ncbi:MAG: serine/threonine protein phosphatase [Candidatus Bathyarchaeota archaeon]|nr:serine/threonine protein phosphatase [Candidatus Bathyarchaeota archaeon]
MNSALVVVNPKKYDRIGVVGDLHGDYKALDALLGLVDLNRDLLVFLGDYADRGAFGVETIRRVAALHKEHPNNVVALMGNHEDYTNYGEPKFSPATLINEAEAKVGSWNRFFKDEFKPFIDSLQLSALIQGNALLVHGGVSSKLTKIDDLKSPSADLRLDILWSDPFDGEGERPNRRGAGVEFGADVSASVCRALGVERIIRSHQPMIAKNKPHYAHGGRVVTVQATSVYDGVPLIYFIDPVSSKNDYYIKR